MKKSNNQTSRVTFNTGNFLISKYWSFYIRSFEILTPTLYNSSQNWHITGFLNIECKKYKNLKTKCVKTSPGLPCYIVTKKFK